MVGWMGVTEYGDRIAELAAKMFCSSVSEFDVCDCGLEARSETVRATSVTLRSTATPEENSTVPKNIASIRGTMTANSVAAIPLLSPSILTAQRRARSHIGDVEIVFIVCLRKARCGKQPSRSTVVCCRTAWRCCRQGR